MSDFEIIDEDEFKKAQARKASAKPATGRKATAKYNTDDRTKTGWYKLPHSMGFCTVPSHDLVMETIKPEGKVYRQRYPSRMVIQIGDYLVCRDCYLAEADLA